MTHCTDRIIANKFMYPWKFRSVLFFSPPNSGKKILDSCLSLTLAHFYDTLQMYAYTKSVLNRFSFSLFFPFFLQPIVYTPSNYNPPTLRGKNFLIHAFPNTGTLSEQLYIRHSPIGSWNPESTLSLYSSFRLTISGQKNIEYNAHLCLEKHSVKCSLNA